MAERLAGVEANIYHKMLGTIRANRYRNTIRTNLFEAKKRLDKVGFSVPDSMSDFAAAISWPEKAVKVPASHIRPSDFVASGQSDVADELNERFSHGYVRTMERMAIDSSLTLGCSFMFTTPGDLLGGDPDVVISTRSALEATAIVDRRTLRPSSALEVFDEKTSIVYFPGEVVVVELVHGELRVTDRIKGVGQRVQGVPFAWDRTVSKPFGRSRISRPVMDYSGMAVRTMLRQEVQAEHLSSPQRVLEGARESAFIDAKGDKKSMWDIATGSIWGIPDFYDEESGEWRRANLKQLAAASQQPHTDQLKTIAMMFSGATDIPIGQLGIIQDNPSSAEAIRMAESAMVNTVTMQLPSYEDARLELAVNVMGAAHGLSAQLEAEVRKVRPTFMEPGTTTPGAQADRAQKFIAANPWAAQSDVALELWGFTASQVSRLRDEMKRQAGASLVRQILGQAQAD